MRDGDDLDVVSRNAIHDVVGVVEKHECRRPRRVSGYRSGASAIRDNACSISRTKPAAAVALRSTYHSVASSSSSSAAGWNLTSFMEASVELCSHFFPRDRFHFAGVDLANTPFDLLGPRCFDALVRITVKTLEETAGKISPLRFGELGCLSKELHYVACHD
jgi:hypothetical protein